MRNVLLPPLLVLWFCFFVPSLLAVEALQSAPSPWRCLTKLGMLEIVQPEAVAQPQQPRRHCSLNNKKKEKIYCL